MMDWRIVTENLRIETTVRGKRGFLGHTVLRSRGRNPEEHVIFQFVLPNDIDKTPYTWAAMEHISGFDRKYGPTHRHEIDPALWEDCAQAFLDWLLDKDAE